MSYNGSGTFNITTAGQPVVTGTVISSTAFNALTADLATGLSTAITKDGQTTTTARVPFAQGISSTLVTDATSATTGSIITAGGISTQKALWVGTTSNFAGTMTAVAANFSGLITGSAKAVINPAATPTTAATATQLGVGEATNNASYRLNLGYWVDSGTYRGNIDAITGGAAATLTLNSTGGLVGIGMTPVNILDITQTQNSSSLVKLLNASAGVAAQCLFIASNGTSASGFGITSTGWTPSGMYRADGSYINSPGAGGISILTTAAQPIYFGINSAEVARIDASGNLLVGTTNTGAAVPSGFALNANSTAAYMGIGHPSGSPSGTTYLNFYYNAGQIGSVSQNGTTGVLYNLTSDQRLKTWRTDQRDFRSMILGVDVGDVEWNSVPGSRMLAIMAQQTNEFYPDAITPGKTDADMWQADYGRLAPLALWGVKDLYKIIDDLTTRLAALENK